MNESNLSESKIALALFRDAPTLQTERLLLRKITRDDVNDYFRIASDPVVASHTIWDRHETIEDTARYIEKLIAQYEKKEAFHWGIVHKRDGRLIGRTGLVRIDAFHEKAEIGYVVAREYWNQGIATEAAKEVIRYGFVELGLNRIEARCNYDNPGSYRVMEKLGMTFEGILRKQLKVKGQFVDQKMYSILRAEFEPSRSGER